MSEQKEFKLLERTTKEKADGDTISYKYVPTNDPKKEISLSVKGYITASNLGLPTDSIGDTILVEFGATTMQLQLEMEIEKKKRSKSKKD